MVEETNDRLGKTFISDIILAILVNNIKLTKFIRKNILKEIVPQAYDFGDTGLRLALENLINHLVHIFI
jgi:hypothetical protein